MAIVSVSMPFSFESPLHFRTQRHTKPLPIPKYLVLPLRFSPPLPSAYIIPPKLTFFTTSISSSSSSHAKPTAQPSPQAEGEEQEEEAQENKQHCNDAIIQFLLEECWISESQLPTIMRRSNPPLFKCISTDTAQQVLRLLRDSGFTPDQVRKIILKYPVVLRQKVDSLKPKIELIETLGLSGEDIALVISQQPRILGISLEKNFLPKIQLFVELFGSKADLCKAIKAAPVLLLSDRNVSENVAMKFKYMKSLGFVEDEILEIFKNSPRILTLSTENLENKWKHIVNIGFNKDQIKKLFKKLPLILTLSIDKMQKNMDFLTHTAGFHPDIVLTYPKLLTYSMDNRLNPRFKVLKYLTAIQPSKSLTISLATVFTLSEEKFAQRFLMDSSQAAKLYESCKRKYADHAVT